MKRSASVVVLALALPAAAATDTDAPTAVHCIDLIRIQRSEILDSQNMLFELTGGDLYLNRFPHPCPGLRKNDTYMTRTSLNRLCNLDIITELNQTGFGFTPGASCGLGMFEPVTEAQVEMVKREIEQGAPD